MTTIIAEILFTILFWSGVNYNSELIGQEIGEAIDNGYIDFTPLVSDDSMNDMIAQVDARVLSNIYDVEITEEMLKNSEEYAKNGIPSDILDEIGIDVPAFMEANSDGIDGTEQFIQDGYTITGENGNSVVFKWEVGTYQENYGDPTYYLNSYYYDSEGKLCDVLYAHAIAYGGKLQQAIDRLQFDPETKGVQFYNYTYWRDGIYGGGTHNLSYWLEGKCVSEASGETSTELADVGTALIDGAATAINPDGSVTLSDGTTIPMNADGTYTINGETVTPQIDVSAYDDTAMRELINQLIGQIEALSYQLELENDTALDVSVDVAYEGTLSEFLLDSRIMQVFPFCLPADFYRGVKLFSADPVTPRFVHVIDIPPIGFFEGTEIVIDIDMSPFESLAFISRWVSTVGFSLTLVFVSTKLPKGAGA